MAWIVGDGFDYYGATADLARSVWDSMANAPGAFLTGASTRFGVGQAVSSGVSWTLQKNLATNEGTTFLALAYYRPGAQSGTNADTYLVLRDGATAQCTVVFESSGAIVLKSGIQTGTVLATYASAFAQDVWTHFQVRVVISNTAGSMTVRKNGQTSDTYASATNLNTRGGTANNYANVAVLGTTVGSMRLDDVLLYSATAPAPNDWVGDIRAVTLLPAADTAVKQMTPVPATSVFTPWSAISSSAWTANLVRYQPFTAARSGVLTKLSVQVSGTPVGHMRMALYAADGGGGLAGTLLAQSAEVTNPAAGIVDFAISGGSLVSGRPYWFAWHNDVSVTLVSGSASPAPYQQVQTYATGFPSVATPVTGSGSGPYFLYTLASNVTTVSEALANSDTDYVFDSVVGHEDLYDLDNLPVTPAAVIGVVAKVFIKKSDAGARNGMLRTRSGATDANGADTVLGTTYTYLSRVDTVDPATGVAWTPTAVNALQVGQKVTA